MRQKCVKNASEMRQKCVKIIGKRGTLQNASEMHQNCVKNASKMRGTPLGESTFWTIPIEIRHIHAQHEEIRHHLCGPSRWPLHLCRQTSTKFGPIQIKGVAVSFRYAFITCLHTQQNKGVCIFLFNLGCLTSTIRRAELLFIHGIASLQKGDCP